MVHLQMDHLAGARQLFDKLLTKTHVAYALVQPQDKKCNQVSSTLATIMLLSGTEIQLQAAYEAKKKDLKRWHISPTRVYPHSRSTFLSDERYQRAYMDFFSQELLQHSGRANIMAVQHISSDTDPLIYGLFGNFAQPLTALSDAFELQSPIMVVQSLTLACVHYDISLRDLLTDALQNTQTYPPTTQPPLSILQAIGHDGRFSNVVHQPGYATGTRQILSNPTTREAIVYYISLLDTADPTATLSHLSSTSLSLLTSTHKSAKPAFDASLSALPTLVNASRVLLTEFDDYEHSQILLRGVWMMFVLSYITQMRPVIDPAVRFTGPSLPRKETHADWDVIFTGFRHDNLAAGSKYLDSKFLRTLRSLYELETNGFVGEGDGVQAAYKLRWQWRRWTGDGSGSGNGGGEGLNVRL